MKRGKKEILCNASRAGAVYTPCAQKTPGLFFLHMILFVSNGIISNRLYTWVLLLLVSVSFFSIWKSLKNSKYNRCSVSVSKLLFQFVLSIFLWMRTVDLSKSWYLTVSKSSLFHSVRYKTYYILRIFIQWKESKRNALVSSVTGSNFIDR